MPVPQRKSPSQKFLETAGLVACGLLVLWVLLFSHGPAAGGRAVGTPMPAIKATGWLNGSAPSPEEFAGKVLVIDAWASWCGPCRQAAPEMVHLYEKYHDQGVEFLGLSAEGEDALPAMEAFLKSAEITWKNGYGAEKTLEELGAEYIPMVWVVDRQQQIVWNIGSDKTLEQGIKEALAGK